MKKVYFLSFLIISATVLFSCKKDEPVLSKGFIKYFGGVDIDAASDVQQTSDGGYIIIGTTNSLGNGGSDMYVVKTDASGNKEWEKTFGGSMDDKGASVKQTMDGGYVFLGAYEDVTTSKTDIYLVKADGNGNQVWSQKYNKLPGVNNLEGISIALDGNSYVIIGNTDLYAGDVVIFTVDLSGVLEQSTITQFPNTGGSFGEYAVNVLTWNSGEYVVSLDSDSIGPEHAFFSKSSLGSSSPATVDKNTLFELSMDAAGEIAEAANNNFVRTGKTDIGDAFLVKVKDKNAVSGLKIWFNTYGGPGIDEGLSVQTASNGGYVILGSTTSFGAGSKDIYLIKVNETGDQEWFKTFGGAGSDAGKIVRRTSDGGYIILGTVEFGNDPSSKDNMICLIKVTQDGKIEN